MYTKNSEPKVSVVMPVYNAERFVIEAIESVLNQTYKKFELLIIDDCSTDGTYNLVQKIAHTDDRIKLYRNEKNLGVADTRNRGFELADGEYVALIDSDDVWRKEKLEKQMKHIGKDNVDMIYCSYGLIDVEGKRNGKDFIVPEKITFSEMLKRSVISCSTVVLSKKVVEVNRFNKEYYHEDYVFWLHCLEQGYLAVGVTEVLADYRIVKDSRSSDKINSAVQRWKIYREYLKLPLGATIYNWLLYVILAVFKYM